MKVRLANYSGGENPTITVYKAYRLCYSRGEQSDIKLPLALDNTVDYGAMERFILDKLNYAIPHGSPLEHISFTFEISGVSRALTHQLVRHRTGKFSQQSQRYVEFKQFDYVIPPQIKKSDIMTKKYVETMERTQETYDEFTLGLCLTYALEYLKSSKKEGVFSSITQNKHDHITLTTLDYFLENMGIEQVRGEVDKFLKDFKSSYPDELRKFMKKSIEDARYIFPNACTSNITVTMDLNNFRKFYALRYCSHAQWEIRRLARLMKDTILPVVPWAVKLAMPCKMCKEKCNRGEV